MKHFTPGWCHFFHDEQQQADERKVSVFIRHHSALLLTDVPYLGGRRGVLRLLVVSDPKEAREPQRDAFFWIHLRTDGHHHSKNSAVDAQGELVFCY